MASININDVNPYTQITASASQTVFTANFVAYAATDVLVYLTPSGDTPDDSTDLLTLNTDYTLAGVGGSSGLTITLTVASFPTGAASGDIVTITRAAAQSRLTQFTTNGQLTADALNEQLNSQIIMAQDDRMWAKYRTPIYQNTDTIADKDRKLPVLSASEVWMMNDTNTGIIGVEITDSDGCSTLRSELANENDGTDGSRLVGHYSMIANETTVNEELERISALQAPISDGVDIVKNAADPTKRVAFDASAITTATTRTLIMPDQDVHLGTGTHLVGDIKANNAATMSGWLKLGAGSIGNASSSGTARANADTEALFTHLWDNYPDATCAVSGGRGASAAADFAANKNIGLPPSPRMLVGPGTVGSTTFTAGALSGSDEVTLEVANLPPHTHGLDRELLAPPLGALPFVTGSGSILQTGSTGSATPFNVIPPVLCVQHWIYGALDN